MKCIDETCNYQSARRENGCKLLKNTEDCNGPHCAKEKPAHAVALNELLEAVKVKKILSTCNCGHEMDVQYNGGNIFNMVCRNRECNNGITLSACR